MLFFSPLNSLGWDISSEATEGTWTSPGNHKGRMSQGCDFLEISGEGSSSDVWEPISMKAHRNHGVRQTPTEAEDWVCLDVQLLKDSRNFRGKGLLAPLWFMQQTHHPFSCP